MINPHRFILAKRPLPDVNEQKLYSFCKPFPGEQAFVVYCYNQDSVPGYEIASMEYINNRSLLAIFIALVNSLDGQSKNPGFNPTWMQHKDEWKDGLCQTYLLLIQYYKTVIDLMPSGFTKELGLLPTWFRPHEQIEEAIYQYGYAVDKRFNDYLFGHSVRTSYSAAAAMWAHEGDTLIFNLVAPRSIFPVSLGDDIADKRSVKNSFANYIPVIRSQFNFFPYEVCPAFANPQGILVVTFDKNACIPLFKVKLRKTLPQDNGLSIAALCSQGMFNQNQNSEQPTKVFKLHLTSLVPSQHKSDR